MSMKISLRMLLHHKARFVFTLLGLGALFFLSASQVGMLVGWCNTISAIIREAGVDVWVMGERNPAFDYGPAIPRNRIYQVRSVPGVKWTEGMYVGWSMWQRHDGRRISIQLIGLDRGSVGGPWAMVEGKRDVVHLPDTVILDELFLEQMGIKKVGDEGEMFGQKAVVRGVCRDVRTFTASPFVFTSLKSAPHYDKGFRPDETTYVLVRAAPGIDLTLLAKAIQQEVPSVEALTSAEFSQRSVEYWIIETGIGLTVIITAILGVVVSSVVTSQTLFTITQDNMGNYATLLAVGFSRSKILGYILIQGLVLCTGGVILGSIGYLAASHATARTPLPLEMTPLVFAGLVAVTAGCCLLGSFLSIRSVFYIDPVAVFRL